MTLELNRCKPGKQVGEDRLSTDLLKDFSQEMAVPIWMLFCKCARQNIEPAQWKSSLIIEIFKRKGSARDIGSYRCVQVSPILTNIYYRLLRSQIVSACWQFLELGQYGALPGKGTDIATNLLLQYQQAAEAAGCSYCFFFVDIKSAFDQADRSFFLDRSQLLLEAAGLPATLAERVAESLSSTWASTSVIEAIKVTTRGTRAGSSL